VEESMIPVTKNFAYLSVCGEQHDARGLASDFISSIVPGELGTSDGKVFASDINFSTDPDCCVEADFCVPILSNGSYEL
jgi:hypothetical protein